MPQDGGRPMSTKHRKRTRSARIRRVSARTSLARERGLDEGRLQVRAELRTLRLTGSVG